MLLCDSHNLPRAHLVAELYNGIDVVEQCLGPRKDKVGEEVPKIEEGELVVKEDQPLHPLVSSSALHRWPGTR